MTDTQYQFYTLSDATASHLDFEPIPFPVRSDKAALIFQSNGVDLDALLEELDGFIREHPELAGRYAANAAQLALICATNHVSQDNFMAALGNLNAGLRIDPQHQALRVHQALALQINGYTEAAALEYDQLLWDAPPAFDPLLRALAAKAFAAIGQRDQALEILEWLPEQAFQDPALDRLRASLRGVTKVKKPEPDALVCPACGEPVLAAHKFCPSCATPLSMSRQAQQEEARSPAQSSAVSKKFCMQCGGKLKPGIKFCTHCGARV
jgi:tetratricopeptide (TPR) repeat protein